MINITIDIKENVCNILSEGHSNKNKKGDDLICCSVSVLLQAFEVNIVELGKGFEYIEKKSGYFKVRFLLDNDENLLFFRSLLLNLKILEKQFKYHLNINLNKDIKDI